MRYSQDHKAQTHQRIIKEASVRFRRDGIGATGLQPLMKALDLTHGGFYAHFKSKDELVEKALQAGRLAHAFKGASRAPQEPAAVAGLNASPRTGLGNNRCIGVSAIRLR